MQVTIELLHNKELSQHPGCQGPKETGNQAFLAKQIAPNGPKPYCAATLMRCHRSPARGPIQRQRGPGIRRNEATRGHAPVEQASIIAVALNAPVRPPAPHAGPESRVTSPCLSSPGGLWSSSSPPFTVTVRCHSRRQELLAVEGHLLTPQVIDRPADLRLQDRVRLLRAASSTGAASTTEPARTTAASTRPLH